MDDKTNNRKMRGIYNNFHSNPLFKKASDDALLQKELLLREKIYSYTVNFTLEKLSECKKPFKDYINKYGRRQPVHTAYATVNYLLNNACFYSYNFFRTNQPYANRVHQIIIEAESNNQNNKEEMIDVFNALIEIKKVYDDMTLNKILTGEVKKNIYHLFKKFELNLSDDNIDEHMKEIETALSSYPKENTKERIISSFD